MNHTQLIKLLKTFSKSELRQFSRYANSPAFNLREDVGALANYIHQNISDPPLMKKEKVAEAIFPGKAYDDALMRMLTHSLIKIAKTFLIHQALEDDEPTAQLMLVRTLQKRGLEEMFEKEMSATNEIIKSKTIRNAQSHLWQYRLKEEEIRQLTEKKRSGDVPYQEIFEELNLFFVSDTLRYSSSVLSYKAVSGKEPSNDFLDAVLTWIENFILPKQEKDFEKKLSVLTYYNLFKALKTNEDSFYFRLKVIIIKEWEKFPMMEIRDIYGMTMNYCARKINLGQPEFLEEMFDLMQSGLAHRILFEDEYLSKFVYKNVVTVGLRLEKFDWVKQFIEEYKKHLHPADRNSAHQFNLGIYYYRLKDYEKAMKLLQKADFGDTLTILTAKSILAKIYYDTNSNESLTALLDSFTVFLKRHKNVGYHTEPYLNFIQFVKKMLQSDLTDLKTRQDLREKIQSTQNVVEKDWLLQKLMNH